MELLKQPEENFRSVREVCASVDVAANGTDGLWLATEQSYDAIVLDVMLPGINSSPSRSRTSCWWLACGR